MSQGFFGGGLKGDSACASENTGRSHGSSSRHLVPHGLPVPPCSVVRAQVGSSGVTRTHRPSSLPAAAGSSGLLGLAGPVLCETRPVVTYSGAGSPPSSPALRPIGGRTPPAVVPTFPDRVLSLRASLLPRGTQDAILSHPSVLKYHFETRVSFLPIISFV